MQDRQTDSPPDRQSDRPAGRQLGNQAVREKGSQTDRQASRQEAGRQTHRHTRVQRFWQAWIASTALTRRYVSSVSSTKVNRPKY